MSFLNTNLDLPYNLLGDNSGVPPVIGSGNRGSAMKTAMERVPELERSQSLVAILSAI